MYLNKRDSAVRCHRQTYARRRSTVPRRGTENSETRTEKKKKICETVGVELQIYEDVCRARARLFN